MDDDKKRFNPDDENNNEEKNPVSEGQTESKKEDQKIDDSDDIEYNYYNYGDLKKKPVSEKKEKPKLSKQLPGYLLVIAGYIGALLILLLAFDNWIMPGIVHDKSRVITPEVAGKKVESAEETLVNNHLVPRRSREQFSGSLPAGYVIRQIPHPGKEVKTGRAVYLTVSKGKETVPVPKLIGKSLREARILLMGRGLNLKDIDYENSEVIPKDSIISQSTDPGKQMAYGDGISVVVSKGSEMQVKVPDITGISVSEVADFLALQGFRLGTVTYRENETFLPGIIIDQYPKSNEIAQYNSSINVIVSR
ncbi:MAG: PASTA domain-containing protein [Bacteroidota bacterium]